MLVGREEGESLLCLWLEKRGPVAQNPHRGEMKLSPPLKSLGNQLTWIVMTFRKKERSKSKASSSPSQGFDEGKGESDTASVAALVGFEAGNGARNGGGGPRCWE